MSNGAAFLTPFIIAWNTCLKLNLEVGDAPRRFTFSGEVRDYTQKTML